MRPAKRAQRRDARFVNTAMVVTLLGATSSDQLEDGRVVSGPGGQHDLVAMAHELEGARSIIGVRSTRRQQRRTAPTSSGATPMRPCRASCATSSSPSTASPICGAIGSRRHRGDAGGLRQPPSRPGWWRQAKGAGKLERDFRARRSGAASNRAERIVSALAPVRRDGLAARVPIGHRDDRGRAGADRAADAARSPPAMPIWRGTLAAGLASGPTRPREPRSSACRSPPPPPCSDACHARAWCWARCGSAV